MIDMFKNSLILSTIIALFLLPQSPVFASSTRYVTDDLTIPMRTGTTNRHKILKFIPSGTMLTILETSEDGTHIKTRIDGIEGWIESKLLVESPGAREQLIKVQQRLDAITQDNAPMQQKIDSANQQVDELSRKNKELMRENEQLNRTITKFKTAAAEPIKIAEENEQLSKEIDAQRNINDALINENAQLKDNNIKEWFVIGAIVSLGSLIFGLIIPSISWRRKKSWGEF